MDGWLVGWLVILFYGVSTHYGLFNAKLNFKQFSLEYSFCWQKVKHQNNSFKFLNSSISNNSVEHKYVVWMSKQFYFKQFSLA